MNSALIPNLDLRQENVALPLRIDNPNTSAAPGRHTHSLVILDNRELDRQCLAQCMAAQKADLQILAFGSIEEWKQKRDEYPPLSAILLNVGGKKIDEPTVSEQIRKLSSEFASTPLIVLADSDDFGQIVRALEYGAKGFIPASVSVSVCMELIALSVAGGIFCACKRPVRHASLAGLEQFDRTPAFRHIHGSSGRSRGGAATRKGKQNYRL